MEGAIQIKKDLLKLADKEKAKLLQGFFKTGQGEYGEGDIFLGITVPEQRKVAKKYKDMDLNEIQELLNSKFHEHRLVALLILVEKYERENNKKQIVDFYLKNTRNINNWDLVDLTSHKILGDYLLDKDRSLLIKLAHSEDLWEKRISIISTFAFINKNQSEDSFKIAEILLNDKHDLIHKAVGWMLREVGKRVSQDAEERFLKKHYKTMPRTMLRYAIERFDEKKRKYYLNTI
jgi:3-methyladenine DNA glycosylase AlkD